MGASTHAGTSVVLYGTPGAFSSYTISLDGTIQPGSPNGEALGSFDGLTNGHHSISLQTVGTSGADPTSNPFVFYEADVTVGTGLSG